MRTAPEEIYLRELLDRIGSGRPFKDVHGRHAGDVQIPPENVVDTLDEAIEHCFPPEAFANPKENSAAFAANAILCPTNDAVGQINAKAMELIPGEVRTYESFDSPLESRQRLNDFRADLNIENIHKIENSSVPPHLLHLKVFL